MKIPKQVLIDLLYDDKFTDDHIVDKTRWPVIHSAVFEHEGHYYCTSYLCGATEHQEELPCEYEPDEIEVEEVRKVSKTVEVWEHVVGP